MWGTLMTKNNEKKTLSGPPPPLSPHTPPPPDVIFWIRAYLANYYLKLVYENAMLRNQGNFIEYNVLKDYYKLSLWWIFPCMLKE